MEISVGGAATIVDVAARRAEKVAQLDARNAERAAARDSRRSGIESARAAEGNAVNVARSSDEFWALFHAGDAGAALAPARACAPRPANCHFFTRPRLSLSRSAPQGH
jgi:hypothetical protein